MGDHEKARAKLNDLNSKFESFLDDMDNGDATLEQKEEAFKLLTEIEFYTSRLIMVEGK